MKNIIAFLLFISTGFISYNAQAQDTLPKFNIRDINDKKILITWISPFSDNCIQLAVQRSFDSTHFFSTIYSAQSPGLPQNGVVDLRMPKGVKVFYRIFYVLDGGAYFFTKSIGVYSYQPVNGTSNTMEEPRRNNQRETGNTDNEASGGQVVEKRLITVFKRIRDTVFAQFEYRDFRRFRDSIVGRTKDTLYTINPENVVLKQFVPKPVWKPSIYVFVSEPNNAVTLHSPLVKYHKYRIVFYEEDGTELFQIKQPKDADLTLDNADFIHAGWFFFDLYEDDKLKEHNKFQIFEPF